MGAGFLGTGLGIWSDEGSPFCSAAGSILPQKVEMLGNMISGILRSSHCFVMSAFFAIRGLNQMPLDLPHNNGSQVMHLKVAVATVTSLMKTQHQTLMQDHL